MEKRKVGILTQPLHDNYGGLLQAYSLKTVLESMGLEVAIINRRKPKHSLKYRVARLLNQLRGRKVVFLASKKQQAKISKHTRYFAEKYIGNITPPIFSKQGLKKLATDFDGFVVGSDQVWKPSYSPQITNYYLDFVENTSSVNVAYAASFGGEKWDYTQEQTQVCKQNVHKFKGISVREDSAVDLCRDNLAVQAVHVLDPTMLLASENFIKLIKLEKEPAGEDRFLMHYVLDKNPTKQSVIDQISQFLELKARTVTQGKSVTKENLKNHFADCVYPSVTSWLNGFYTSSFVVTDSFHGTVFSILFNKPFIVVANPQRGNARFHSLLKMFDLEDRLIMQAEEFSIPFFNELKDIDWEAVNKKIEEKRGLSLEFLKNNLQF